MGWLSSADTDNLNKTLGVSNADEATSARGLGTGGISTTWGGLGGQSAEGMFKKATSSPDAGQLDTDPAKQAAKSVSVPTPGTTPNTQIKLQPNAFTAATPGSVNAGPTGDGTANDALTKNLAFLQAMASGQGGSVAQNQLQQGREANIAATMAQAASQRGGFNPLLARQALQSGATQNAQANQQAATQRLQEQMAAAGQIAQQGTTMRGQDINASTSNAQMQTQTSLANMQAQLQQALAQGQISAQQANQIYQTQAQALSQTEALRAQYMQMGYSADQANIAAQQAANVLKAQKQAAVVGGLANVLTPAIGSVFGGQSATPTTMGQGATASTTAMPMEGGAGATWAGGDAAAAGGAGGLGGATVLAAHGGMVPGQAPKEGDHPDNDIIPAKLSPGEFVLPRSLTADKELMQLVHKKMAEHQVRKAHVTASQGFADVLKAHAELNAKMDALKKFMGGY